jgi:hypothetical protein
MEKGETPPTPETIAKVATAGAAKLARLSVTFGEKQQKNPGSKMIFSLYVYPHCFQHLMLLLLFFMNRSG